MLPPTTTPAYSSSSMHNQLAFPPLTPASGMSTQELRVPTTYQAGSHSDQRGTLSGTNAMNTMYASSEDRHPRQRSGSKDQHHRDRGSSDDRHRRRDSGSDDRYHRRRSRSDDRHPRQPEDGHRRKRSRSGDSYHREYDHSDDRHRHESGSMSSSLSSSQRAWQSRPGQNYPAFPGSRVVPARQLNAQMMAYQRMLKFGSADPPKLTKNTLESVAVDIFIKYLHQLLRADAFDDSVIINLITGRSIGM